MGGSRKIWSRVCWFIGEGGFGILGDVTEPTPISLDVYDTGVYAVTSTFVLHCNTCGNGSNRMDLGEPCGVCNIAFFVFISTVPTVRNTCATVCRSIFSGTLGSCIGKY